MAYVTIPKDLSRIQSKVLFRLTKRQVICFGAAALCMILVMLPFFLFAMYEKNGQPPVSYTHLWGNMPSHLAWALFALASARSV